MLLKTRSRLYEFGVLSTQNKLFGNRNKANDQTQQYIQDEKQNSPTLFTRKL